jgi:hypothetical protein
VAYSYWPVPVRPDLLPETLDLKRSGWTRSSSTSSVKCSNPSAQIRIERLRKEGRGGALPELGFWRGFAGEAVLVEGRRGPDDFWTTERMRRRSARRGGLGNELLRVDCVQTMEGGAAGAWQRGDELRVQDDGVDLR